MRFVIAESFERIHRSNLVGMGRAPAPVPGGRHRRVAGPHGTETYAVRGLHGDVVPGQTVTVEAARADGTNVTFPVTVRVDGDAEVAYMRAGGVLNLVLTQMLQA